MKRFTAITLAALMVLTVFASVIPVSAVTVESVEVRGPVYNGINLTTIFEADGIQDGNNSSVYYLEMNETNFAGFFYDIDEDVATEVFRIYNHSDTKSLINGERTIEEDGIVYETTIDQVNYDFDGDGEWKNETYNLMGFFAEKYVPLDKDTPDKLCKLLLDTDDKHTLRTGTVLDLAGGYAITAKQVDVEGDKVWLELTKDGEFVEDEVVSLPAGGVADWNYEPDVADEDDVEVFRVRITDVFQGQVDSLAVIEGIWLIDYENVLEIDSDDEYGAMEVSDIGTYSIELKNKNSITLSKDSVKDIAEGMNFKIADSTPLRFYLMKEYTDAGTYEVRGNVVTGDGDASWNYEQFAGFFYDLDDDTGTESLNVSFESNRTIGDEQLTYITEIEQVEYDNGKDGDAWDNQTYNVIGFFAEKYVPLDKDTPDKLCKLLLDTDDKHTLRTGTVLDLTGGYAITAKQVDVEGDKVWLELTKDGEFVEDEVVSLPSGGEADWNYDPDVADEDDVMVFRVRITDVFQGQIDSLAVIEGIWLIDYENVLEIDSDDEFGAMEVSDIGTSSLELKNKNSITLSDDSIKDIAGGMKFKVADSNTLRYYPFVEYTIGDTTSINDTPINDTPINDTPINDTPIDDPIDDTPIDDPIDDTPINDTPINDTPIDDPGIPGFASIFAITGLLAVAYLVRRN